MNNLSIVGRVGKDAEVRDAGRNKVVNFSIAWSSPFGEKETTWFNVSLFGERFVKLATYMKYHFVSTRQRMETSERLLKLMVQTLPFLVEVTATKEQQAAQPPL